MFNDTSIVYTEFRNTGRRYSVAESLFIKGIHGAGRCPLHANTPPTPQETDNRQKHRARADSVMCTIVISMLLDIELCDYLRQGTIIAERTRSPQCTPPRKLVVDSVLTAMIVPPSEVIAVPLLMTSRRTTTKRLGRSTFH